MRVVYGALYIDLTPAVQINLRKRETNLRSFLYPGTNVWIKLFELSERPAHVSVGSQHLDHGISRIESAYGDRTRPRVAPRARADDEGASDFRLNKDSRLAQALPIVEAHAIRVN